MPHVHINYLAVLAAAVAAFAVGGLWYSPLLFAKPWVKAHGFSEERVAQMQKTAGKAYAVSMLCQLLMAFAMAVLIGYLQIVRCVPGLKLAALIWAGFAFPLGLMANVFSDKRIAVFYIDTGYQFVYLLVMGSILAIWH